jgi:hypothetical protein
MQTSQNSSRGSQQNGMLPNQDLLSVSEASPSCSNRSRSARPPPKAVARRTSTLNLKPPKLIVRRTSTMYRQPTIKKPNQFFRKQTTIKGHVRKPTFANTNTAPRSLVDLFNETNFPGFCGIQVNRPSEISLSSKDNESSENTISVRIKNLEKATVGNTLHPIQGQLSLDESPQSRSKYSHKVPVSIMTITEDSDSEFDLKSESELPSPTRPRQEECLTPRYIPKSTQKLLKKINAKVFSNAPSRKSPNSRVSRTGTLASRSDMWEKSSQKSQAGSRASEESKLEIIIDNPLLGEKRKIMLANLPGGKLKNTTKFQNIVKQIQADQKAASSTVDPRKKRRRSSLVVKELPQLGELLDAFEKEGQYLSTLQNVYTDEMDELGRAAANKMDIVKSEIVKLKNEMKKIFDARDQRIGTSEQPAPKKQAKKWQD